MTGRINFISGLLFLFLLFLLFIATDRQSRTGISAVLSKQSRCQARWKRNSLNSKDNLPIGASWLRPRMQTFGKNLQRPLRRLQGPARDIGFEETADVEEMANPLENPTGAGGSHGARG